MFLHAAQLPILALCLLSAVFSLDPLTQPIGYKVLEEQPSGTRIGKLADDLRLRGASGELGDFHIVDHVRALPFVVGVTDGAVSTVGPLDREALCKDSDPCVIQFNVLYRKGGAIDFLQVMVEVMDLNDHSPSFPNIEQEIEISETATLRMRIPLDRAQDPDAGPNALQTYSLSPNQHFALDVVTRSEGTKHAELVVIKELDREVQSSFELTLVAWDKGNPPRSGSTLVKVNVLDSNDNSPVFEDSVVTVELSENTPRGTTVINLKATDPDQGANGEIEYSFSKHVPLDVQNLFAIDPKTGAVTLIGELDYEEKRNYEIDIQARDLGPNAIPSHCKLQIKVLDVNDNAPNILVTWAPQDSDVALVSEASTVETFLALVMVSDADSGDNGKVHCQIKHGQGHFRLKKIHRDNYMIVTSAVLDRESKTEYNLTLIAEDHGTPRLTFIEHLTVHVLDENDNAPVFSKDLYEASIRENNDPGLHVLTVEAHDIDLELSGTFSFSIRESSELVKSSFTIHPTDGAIYAQRPFDFEQSKHFTLIVEATDQGHRPLTSSTTVQINIQDVNDNYPVIEEPVQKRGRASINIPVNMETGEIVTELGDTQTDSTSDYFFQLSSGTNNTAARLRLEGYPASTIKASDMDSGINGAVCYRIINGNAGGLFLLDEFTGQIYVNTSNATELIGKVFEIDIAVSDMGSPSLVTKATLEIIFINLQDHLKNSSPGQKGQLSFTMMLVICLGATCLLLLLVAALVTTFCRTEKRDNHAYNCRQAESTYTRHPRRPQKHIQKADIQLVPVLRGRKEEPTEGDPQKPSTPVDDVVPDIQESFLPCQFSLSPSLSRTIRNQTFPEDNRTLPLPQTRTLRKPSNIEIDGTLPRTPATPYRTLRRAKISEDIPSAPDTVSHMGTLRCQGSPEIQRGSGETSDSSSSSPAFRTLRRPRNAETKMKQESEDHHRILRNLVRMSMAAFGEYNPIELSSASPEVQQVSQLLSLLHQGQFQPRPNFRGNKYSHRAGRSGAQDADWLSTKDSGHGESEAGDMDWDTGRDSPTDHLLGEGLDTLLNNTDDVFSDFPDPAWMARLSLPLTTDYRENVFVPEDARPPEESSPLEAAEEGATCFSTFGKTSGKGVALPGHLLSEVSTLFEMLLTQKADSQAQPAAEVLYRLSAAYRRSLGLDGAAGGATQTRHSGAENRSPAALPAELDSPGHHMV
ncbi:protocadherin-12 [Amia ocellicauda]|uniref:protocadherin-12 n=1 Tax=Amia ocellicauda TaxID=2972642 RepID=UPI003464AE0A